MREKARPAEWKEAREFFLSDENLAAGVQRALAEPSAARLYYVREAFRHCAALHAAFNTNGASQSESFARRLARCKQLTDFNPAYDQLESRLKEAARRLSEADSALLSKLVGARTDSQSFSQLLALGRDLDDPYVLGELGSAWAGRVNVTYRGRPLTPSERSGFVTAWRLSACTQLRNCEVSEMMANLCGLGSCAPSLREALAKVESQERLDTIKSFERDIHQAADSGDFAPFQ